MAKEIFSTKVRWEGKGNIEQCEVAEKSIQVKKEKAKNQNKHRISTLNWKKLNLIMKKIQGRHAKIPDEKMENAKGRSRTKILTVFNLSINKPLYSKHPSAAVKVLLSVLKQVNKNCRK